MLFAVATFLVAVNPAPAQNIVDIYLAAPAEVFANLESGRDARLALIAERDLKNGYLVVGPKEDAWSYTLALFNTKQGQMLGVTCDDAGGQELHFYRVGEKWKDVTADVFPKFSVSDVAAAFKKKGLQFTEEDVQWFRENGGAWRAVLPRVGTSIKIVSGIDNETGGKELMTLSFDRTRFLVGK
jgi:hypothetical protein